MAMSGGGTAQSDDTLAVDPTGDAQLHEGNEDHEGHEGNERRWHEGHENQEGNERCPAEAPWAGAGPTDETHDPLERLGRVVAQQERYIRELQKRTNILRSMAERCSKNINDSDLVLSDLASIVGDWPSIVERRQEVEHLVALNMEKHWSRWQEGILPESQLGGTAAGAASDVPTPASGAKSSLWFLRHLQNYFAPTIMGQVTQEIHPPDAKKIRKHGSKCKEHDEGRQG